MKAPTFDDAFAQVQPLLADFDANKAHYLSPAYQETEVRADFINKLFLALGWDVNHDWQKNPFAQEVKVERGVQAGASQRRADYAFYIAPNFRDVRFFTEAKKPFGDIATADHYFQVIRYGWNAQTPVAVLTDFEQFQVVDCRYKPDIATALSQGIRKYHFTDYADKEKFAEIFHLFSREAVASGSLEKLAETLPKKRGKAVQRGMFKGGTQRFDDAFLEELDGHRDTLARAFKNRNPDLDGDTLTEITQRTLDRLVFIRFLEDKLIHPEHLVANFGDQGTAWQDFVAASRKLDGIYNGIVFKKHALLDEPGFKVDEDAFADICKKLAHVNTAYDFNAIPIHILGSIYERFLGKVIVTTDKRARVEEKPEVRKAGGVYYTPDYIVRYIVENTVGKLIAGKTPAQIAEMRFADIACGSGSFLLGVYDLLLRHHRDWFNANPDKAKKAGCVLREDGLPAGQAGAWHLSLKQRREILLHNIYGVDIDHQAVEVAQLSLYLKLLEEETTGTAREYQMEFHETLLPSLSRNIVCGNSLIGTDISAGQLFAGEEERKLNPMDFEDRFPEIMKRGGFDAVVGNPPYVRMEAFKEIKDYLESHYQSHDERTDLYVYFIERALKVIRPGGRYGIIVSNKWVRSKYGDRLRCVVTANAAVESMIDFGELPVFQGAATFPVVFIARCGKPDRAYSFSFTDGFDREFFQRISHREMELQEAEKLKSTTVTSANLAETVWKLGSVKSVDLLAKLSKTGQTLNQYTQGQIRYGIKTGLVEAFVIDAATRNRLVRESPKAANVIKPYVLGDDVRKYHISDRQRHLIYTYHGIDMRGCDSILRYLEPFKDRLRNRATKQEWYELQQPQQRYAPDYERPKIIYPDIAKESRFAFDPSGIYPADTTFVIPLADFFLLGILNSRVAFYFLSQVCPVLGDARHGGRLRLKLNYVQTLPVPVLNCSKSADKARHDRLVALVEQMLAAQKQLAGVQSDADKDFYGNKCAGLDRQIDALVYELYALTPDEIKIVEGAVA